jgi:hypothetical protein
MSEENELKQAQAVYKSLCDMLDERKWNYDRHDDELTITCGTQGDDLPIDLVIQINKQLQIITLLSKLPFVVKDERRVFVAIAVSQANNGMVDGSFDFNCLSGSIIFRMTSSYRESLISKDLLEYMLLCSCYTIDEYNDKFFVVAKNDMSIDEILDYIQ